MSGNGKIIHETQGASGRRSVECRLPTELERSGEFYNVGEVEVAFKGINTKRMADDLRVKGLDAPSGENHMEQFRDYFFGVEMPHISEMLMHLHSIIGDRKKVKFGLECQNEMWHAMITITMTDKDFPTDPEAPIVVGEVKMMFDGCVKIIDEVAATTA